MSLLLSIVFAGVWQARSVDAILARNIFCSGCVNDPHATAGASSEGAGASESRLPLELVAILRCPTDDRWTVAVIVGGRDHQPRLYARGAHLEGRELTRIEARRVWLRDGERTEYLTLDAAPVAPANPESRAHVAPVPLTCQGSRCQLPRATVEKLLADPSQLASWARVLPAPNGGLTLLSVRADTLLAQMGLKSGDRLRAINGVELGNLEQMLRLYTQLRHASALSVRLERAGATLTLDYTIR